VGAWCAGLYSSDFACDLRSTIAATARLPFDAGRILEIVRESTPETADDPASEDYTTFWLVTADQFQKRGLESKSAFERAIAIVDSGSDDVMMRKLGLRGSDLRKRATMVLRLRERLTAGVSSTQRRTLARPQPYTMDAGDVLRFPVSRGQPINPYASDRGFGGRAQEGWAAMLVVSQGRAFDYLAWYSIAIVKNELAQTPAIDMLMDVPWVLRGAGTCSPRHFRRMEFECIANVSIHREALVARLGKPWHGNKEAVLDISISNRISVVSANPSQPVVQRDLERLPAANLREFATISERYGREHRCNHKSASCTNCSF
jgi:hypothetical protein